MINWSDNCNYNYYIFLVYNNTLNIPFNNIYDYIFLYTTFITYFFILPLFLWPLKQFNYPFQEYPTPRGIKKNALIKYGVGGLLLFVLIFVIWFPLLLFSLASAVFQANPPVELELVIQFDSYQVSLTSNLVNLILL